MIDRGDIRQAIDRCSNIWASLPGAGYGQFEHKADSLIAKFKEAGGTVREIDMRQRDVAALDAKYTKELADAKAENDALRDDVAAGRRRLHIKAVCQSVREATTASGVDNAASPDWQTPLNGIISPSERG
ncbi:spanin, inner membrane subunit [Trichonephila clavipes]|nr:spanin, inner membrane subunit [Trichonephila clavipes]